MRHPVSHFEPAVTVSALALNNVTHLPYFRLRLTSTPSTSTASAVATRAKWLEHGVGSHTAFHAAAIAQLSETVPAVLAVSIPHPSTSPSPPKPPRPTPSSSLPPAPSLWLFASAPMLQRALTQLKKDFTVIDSAIWTPKSLPVVTRALTIALRRTIATAMQSERALRVGDDVIHPQASLSFTFHVSLGHGPNPHILIRVSARHLNARHIDDDDSAAALIPNSVPLKVFTAPLGLCGVLSSRPCAGDALSSSVFKRWREAGLLRDPLIDSTVVFLKLEDGVEVPFPRTCVLTTQSKTSPIITESDPDTSPLLESPSLKSWKSNVALWRSRKRPRSPVSISDDDAQIPSLSPKQEAVSKPPIPVPTIEEKSSEDAPTAHTLNAALLNLQAAQPTTPVPNLHHPLMEPMPLPTFQNAPDPPIIEIVKELKSDLRTDSNVTEKPQCITEPPTSTDEPALKPSSSPRVGQSSFHLLDDSSRQDHSAQIQSTSNGLEAFLLGGADNASDPVNAFEASGAMDMTDFSAFDDDVTAFFRDSMDDRMPGDDNALLESVDSAPPSASVQPDSLVDHDSTANDLLAVDHNGAKSASDSQMDVDSAATSNSGDNVNPDDLQPTFQYSKSGQGSASIIDSTLAALRRPLPTSRPDPGAIKSQLSSKYEEDHLQRQTTHLKASRSICKRECRAKLDSRNVLIAKSFARSSHGFQGGSGILKNLEAPFISGSSVSDKAFSVNLKNMYIPQRFMRNYNVLRKKGRNISAHTLRDGYESDSSTSDSDEDDAPPQGSSSGPVPKVEMKSVFSTPLNIPDTRINVSLQGDANSRHGLCVEYDPVKIVDSVAVDCASICMVLAAERASLASNSSSIVETSAISGAEISGSPGARELEPKSATSLPSQNGTRLLPTLMSKTHSPSLIGAPPTRISKKERDFLSMLTLLEMQGFGRKELELFNSVVPSGTEDANHGRVDDEYGPPSEATKKVSSATMRRLLLGLSRSLEMSDTFKTWADSFQDMEKSKVVPSVQGPLSVNSFLGGGASIFPLQSARVCVGYNNNWVENNSGVLPLWEKAGLEPYSESKNVEYFALGPKDLEEDVSAFLRDVSVAYEECLFGKHQAMPSDPLTLISSSVPMVAHGSTGNESSRKSLTDCEKAMAEQYHLATTTIYTKLQAIAKDQRKNPPGSPTNIVVYVISPFGKDMKAANVALLQAVAPLVGTVPGTVPSIISYGGMTANLPSAPWRTSPASKSVMSITVRIIPREVVDRRLVGQTEITHLLDRPLRPQLVKAVCFAVYSSMRCKRIRPSSIDGEVGGILARGTMADDLMSPMTPEVLGEAVGGPYGTPISPMGMTGDEGIGYNINMASVNFGGGNIDQSCALSPSYLHEAAIVLSGPGEHTGELSGCPRMVLHLAYAFCEAASRMVFTWTDRRGELLDTASVPVSRSGFSASRRKAFWGMWARGQRWRLSFVSNVHVTVSKLGIMNSDELEDWEWVLNKVVCLNGNSSGERQPGTSQERRVVRRFPPANSSRPGDELADTYADAPTPATPCAAQPHCTNSSNGSGRNQVCLDVKLPGISSVSVLSVHDADTELFLEKAVDSDKVDRRDFAIITEVGLCNGIKAQANVILARFLENGIGATEISLMRHYGVGGDAGEDMDDDRSEWDGSDAKTIATAIASNFHDLRYVATPPSYPLSRWLSVYPVHVETVRLMQANVNSVHEFGVALNLSGAR